MKTPEQIAQRFLDYLYTNFGDVKHIKRVAPLIGSLVWKIFQIARGEPKYTRQLRFIYKSHYFKAKYNHKIQGRILPRGCLEIVEVIGKEDGDRVCTIETIDEALKLDKELNKFLKKRK